MGRTAPIPLIKGAGEAAATTELGGSAVSRTSKVTSRYDLAGDIYIMKRFDLAVASASGENEIELICFPPEQLSLVFIGINTDIACTCSSGSGHTIMQQINYLS